MAIKGHCGGDCGEYCPERICRLLQSKRMSFAGICS